jgi:hypothetical protein
MCVSGEVLFVPPESAFSFLLKLAPGFADARDR